MYLYKTFKDKEIEFVAACTWRHDWTLGISLHWNLITRKSNPDLDEDLFALDIHILCFQFSFEYWWNQDNG